jgi:hypothetical protein
MLPRHPTRGRTRRCPRHPLVQAVFKTYCKTDANAINTSAPVITYEGFLSALIDVAFRVKRLDQPYLSEAVREYVLGYVSRASKMTPQVGWARGLRE